VKDVWEGGAIALQSAWRMSSFGTRTQSLKWADIALEQLNRETSRGLIKTTDEYLQGLYDIPYNPGQFVSSTDAANFVDGVKTVSNGLLNFNPFNLTGMGQGC